MLYNSVVSHNLRAVLLACCPHAVRVLYGELKRAVMAPLRCCSTGRPVHRCSSLQDCMRSACQQQPLKLCLTLCQEGFPCCVLVGRIDCDIRSPPRFTSIRLTMLLWAVWTPVRSAGSMGTGVNCSTVPPPHNRAAWLSGLCRMGLQPGGLLANCLSEKGVLQLLFDVRFAQTVLASGKPAQEMRAAPTARWAPDLSVLQNSPYLTVGTVSWALTDLLPCCFTCKIQVLEASCVAVGVLEECTGCMARPAAPCDAVPTGCAVQKPLPCKGHSHVSDPDCLQCC